MSEATRSPIEVSSPSHHRRHIAGRNRTGRTQRRARARRNWPLRSGSRADGQVFCFHASDGPIILDNSTRSRRPARSGAALPGLDSEVSKCSERARCERPPSFASARAFIGERAREQSAALACPGNIASKHWLQSLVIPAGLSSRRCRGHAGDEALSRRGHRARRQRSSWRAAVVHSAHRVDETRRKQAAA